MSTTLYGIVNCDTCRKARRWLDRQGIAHDFHDVRTDGLDADMINRWRAAMHGTDLLNRRSTTWRNLNGADRDRADSDPVGLLCEYPALLKRPVLENGSRVSQGFNADRWADVLGIRS